MKALILSDIHANYPALKAVLDKDGSYDKLIFLGDVVDYGPHPKECLTFIKENADYYVLGNHDNALGFDTDCNCMGPFREYSIETRKWHKTILDKDDIKFLRSMPIITTAHFDNNDFYLAHASPQGDISKYLNKKQIETEIQNLIAEFILVGHTHVQYKRQIGNTLVINPGSVGLARDGGEACYAVYETCLDQRKAGRDGNVTLKRIDYDVEKTIHDLFMSPISLSTKESLKKVLLHKSGKVL